MTGMGRLPPFSKCLYWNQCLGLGAAIVDVQHHKEIRGTSDCPLHCFTKQGRYRKSGSMAGVYWVSREIWYWIRVHWFHKHHPLPTFNMTLRLAWHSARYFCIHVRIQATHSKTFSCRISLATEISSECRKDCTASHFPVLCVPVSFEKPPWIKCTSQGVIDGNIADERSPIKC